MKKNTSLYLKILASYLIAVACVLFLVFVLPPMLAFLWPIVVGWIIALIANPLVHFLESKLKIIRKHGSAIVIIVTLAIVIGIIYLILYVLIKQGISFGMNFPLMYKNLTESIQKTSVEYKEKYTFLPSAVRNFIDGIFVNLGKLSDSVINDIIKKSDLSVAESVNVVVSIAEGLIMTIFTILFSYFLTAEHDRIVKVYNDKVPNSLKNGAGVIVNSITTAFGGYFKAQLKIMSCLFVILSIGFFALGVDYALLIAFVIAFVDFLPFFGAGAIMWPWCLYEVFMGNYIKALILFILYIICQGVRQFLQPKMVADSIGMNPLLTLIFMFAGYRIRGILGMIVGIPIGMILVSFYEKGIFDNLIRGAKIIINNFRKWIKF